MLTTDNKPFMTYIFKYTRRYWLLGVLVLLVAESILNALRAGAYYDSKEDLQLAKVNLTAIFSHPQIPMSSFMENLQRSYSWGTLYLTLLPIKLLKLIGLNVGLDDPAGIAYRNIGVLIIFFIGVYALSMWCEIIYGTSKKISFALTFLTPTIAGYAFFDEKDIPAFTGAACGLALIAVCSSTTKLKNHKKMIVLLSAGTTFFIAGSRPGILITQVPCVIALFWVLRRRSEKKIEIVLIAISQVFVFAILYMTSYTFQQEGLLWILRSMQAGSHFALWGGHMVVWGHIFSPGKSPYYLFSVLASQVPEWILALVILGLTLVLIKPRTFVKSHNVEHRFIRLIPIYMLVGLIGYSVLLKPVLYNDARQFLFIWVYILAASMNLLKWISTRIRIPTRFLFLPFLLIPLVNVFILGPFQYAYRNISTISIGLKGFENDFWGISSKQLVSGTLESGDSFTTSNFLGQPLNSVQTYLPSRYKPSNVRPFIYFELNNNNMSENLYPKCRKIYSVSMRELFFQDQELSYAEKCE